jgi:hypothetical protein
MLPLALCEQNFGAAAAMISRGSPNQRALSNNQSVDILPRRGSVVVVIQVAFAGKRAAARRAWGHKDDVRLGRHDLALC